MKLYLIGGLGADKRVFEKLKIEVTTEVIEWIKPENTDDLNSYVKRLSAQIDQKERFGILGVSFGGIVAIELNNIVDSDFIILISSVSQKAELSSFFIFLGKLFLPFIPEELIKPPSLMMNYLFGAKNKLLLKNIIDDTEPAFIKWALKSIIRWKPNNSLKTVLRIHGINDRLIPLKGHATTIENGGHFMIVDNVDQISRLINDYLRTVKESQ